MQDLTIQKLKYKNKFYEKERFDKAAINFIENTTRSQIKYLIQNGCLLLNDKKVKPSDPLVEGDEISIMECCLFENEQKLMVNKSRKIDVLFETSNYIIVNKPFKCVTHPDASHQDNSLVNYVLSHTELYVNKKNIERSGIVHRLDKDTTGAIILVKNFEAQNLFVNMFKNQTIVKKYIAITDGILPNDELLIKLPLARSSLNRIKMMVDGKKGKNAITKIKLLEKMEGNCLVECELKTGRTHQIRVHLEYVKAPVLNDPTYGKIIEKTDFGQYLHSRFLEFIDPFTNKKIQIEAPFPTEFKSKMKEIGFTWKKK